MLTNHLPISLALFIREFSNSKSSGCSKVELAIHKQNKYQSLETYVKSNLSPFNYFLLRDKRTRSINKS